MLEANLLDGGIFYINMYDITGHYRFLVGGERERGRWAGGFENFFSFSFSFGFGFGLVLFWERGGKGEGGIF